MSRKSSFMGFVSHKNIITKRIFYMARRLRRSQAQYDHDTRRPDAAWAAACAVCAVPLAPFFAALYQKDRAYLPNCSCVLCVRLIFHFDVYLSNAQIATKKRKHIVKVFTKATGTNYSLNTIQKTKMLMQKQKNTKHSKWNSVLSII